MTTLVAARMREMAHSLEQQLARLSPASILAINNTSYHAFRLMAAESESGLRPYVSRLRHLNAAYHLKSLKPDDQIVLFVSELEYGRSLREALAMLPAGLRSRASAIALLENAAPDIRRERLGSPGHSPRHESPDDLRVHATRVLEGLHVCHSLDSEAFHEALGALRDTTAARLNRPFNVDATLAFSDVLEAVDEADLAARLSALGPLAVLPHPEMLRWSLLRPACLDTEALRALLPPGVTVEALHFKIRFFGLPDSRRLLIAPMVFARMCVPDRPSWEASEASPPLLRRLLEIQAGSLRTDLSPRQMALAYYDTLSFWLDLVLLRQFAADVSVPWQLERTSLHDYYGPGAAPELLRAATELLDQTPLMPHVAATDDGVPAPFDSVALAVIKTATIKAYEEANEGVSARSEWSRAGLTFEELLARVQMSADATSIGIDLLADAGMTESYNRPNEAGPGLLRIDRAFNSLSGEFRAVLALMVSRLEELRRRHPELGVSTSATTLNKFLALLFYFRGVGHVRIQYNKQGKTVWLDLDAAKGIDANLRNFLALGREYFETGPGGQVALTGPGLSHDWVTHLPNAGELDGIIGFAAGLWAEIAEDLDAAKRVDAVKTGRSTFDVFSAFVDSLGSRSPEWGTATIAHLLEWAIAFSIAGKPEDVRECLHSAGHKLRSLRDGHRILAGIYERHFKTRLLHPRDRQLIQRFAVLPESSQVLSVLTELLRATSEVIAAGEAASMKDSLELWTWLFHNPNERTTDHTARIRTPSRSVSGYVAFVDLVPMMRIAEFHGIAWPLQSVGSIAPRWARLCGSNSGRTLSDALAVVFPDALSATRFACGASLHLQELHLGLSRALELDVWMRSGVAKGTLDVFATDTVEGREITGATLAKSARARAPYGKIWLERSVWDEVRAAAPRLDDLEAEPQASGYVQVDLVALFERLIVADQLARAFLPPTK